MICAASHNPHFPPQLPDQPMDPIDNALKLLAAADQRDLLRRGYHLVKRHYYTPLNDPQWLEENPDLWRQPFVPRDIDWNIPAQLALAREISPFLTELRDIPDKEPPTPPGQSSSQPTFHWHNPFFNTADALVWYGLLRSRKPLRVVEVGCGWSSLLLARALAANADESHPGASVTQIEPFPNPRLFSALPTTWTLHRSPLQRAPLEPFDSLRPGDILFYDGSHCSRVASDLNWLLFRILPRLPAGVLIHFHDIFFPREYPPAWIFQRLQTWNEQYLLQALLMNSSAYRVLIANGLLSELHPDELTALYHGIQKPWGASLWLEKTKDPDPDLARQADSLTSRCTTTPKAHRDPKPQA